jgi:hypothetical protein
VSDFKTVFKVPEKFSTGAGLAAMSSSPIMNPAPFFFPLFFFLAPVLGPKASDKLGP